MEIWINSFLFDEWIQELDKKFEKENRKVINIVDYRRFESCVAWAATKHNFKNPTYGPRSDTFPKSKILQKNIQRLIRAMDMKKTFPKTSILDTMQLLTSGSSEVSEATIKVGISEKLAEEAIND